MPDEKAALKELIHLASRQDLEVNDYERLALGVFCELLANEAAKAELWEKREGGLINFYTYVDGRKAIDDSKALDPCWKRLRQDLYEGNRKAMTGVQCAYAYAKRSGLARNALWGGERRREVERILLRADVDPNAPPGLPQKIPSPEEADKLRKETPEFIAPKVKSESIDKLPLHERLGIGERWAELSDVERHLFNAIILDLDEADKVRMLRKLTGEKLSSRVGNADIPRSDPRWIENFPPQLAGVVAKLPARSKMILGASVERIDRDRMAMLDKAISREMLQSQDRVKGDRLLEIVMREVASVNDSLGAGLRYKMEHEQGKLSFPLYLQLRAQQLPKIASKEQDLAARHADERQKQCTAMVSTLLGDPGLAHIGKHYAEFWACANRTDVQKILATAKGFGGAAVDTVEGVVTLLTTDPRKTAAGIYHLVQHPQILVNGLEDAMMDQDKMMGAVFFELATTAVGAGPASKVSHGAKAAKLAALAEDAAKAGKLRAATKLADAAEDATTAARGTGEKIADAEAAVKRTRDAIETAKKSEKPPGFGPDDGLKAEAPKADGAKTPTDPKDAKAALIRERYRMLAFGGQLLEGTKHIFMQGTVEQVRKIEIRLKQLQRTPEGKALIEELDAALEKTLKADVDADVAKAAKSWNWDPVKDKLFIEAERKRLHQLNRRNRRVVIKHIDEKGRVQCEALIDEAAHRDDVREQVGKGSGSVIHFDPDRWVYGADEATAQRPPTPAIALGHELVHAHRNATGRAVKGRLEEMETIGLDEMPEWINSGKTVTENDLRTGWAKLQKKVVELRKDY
jgi:hypothetical protein